MPLPSGSAFGAPHCSDEATAQGLWRARVGVNSESLNLAPDLVYPTPCTVLRTRHGPPL